MLAVAVGFVIYPLIEGGNDVINSDWPAFATGARILVSDPGHLYDSRSSDASSSRLPAAGLSSPSESTESCRL